MDGKRQKDVSKAFMAETFNSVLLPFFPRTLKVDVQSRSHLTWVQTIMSGASKQTIVLQRELRSGSAPKPSETGMGAVKVGWRCLCVPPDWGDGSWGGWPGLLALPCTCPAACAASLGLLSLRVCWGRLWVRRVPAYRNLVDGDTGNA